EQVKALGRQARRTGMHLGRIDRGAEDAALRREADLPAADPLAQPANDRILDRVRIGLGLRPDRGGQTRDRLAGARGGQGACGLFDLVWGHAFLLILSSWP